MHSLSHAARTARVGQELLEASSGVISRRLEIAAEAIRNPLGGDYAELSLMGSEKVEAMWASAAAGLNGAMAAGEALGQAAAREAEAAGAALQAVASAACAAEALAVQSRWALNVWERALRTGWAFGASMLEAQTDALTPIHAAATANAQRLNRSA